MEVITIEDEAFFKLLDKAIEHVSAHLQDKWKWVDHDEAMRLLNIHSNTTLQDLRNEGKIRFSQPQKKIILYDRDSIAEYLEKHARKTF